MKTTIYVPDEVMKALKTRAVIEQRSQSEIIREALEKAVEGYRPADYPRPRWPYGHGKGNLPPDASEHLDDFMDGFGEQ